MLYQVIHHIIISYYLTRKKSFYFITHAWYCLLCALSMKYECTQSIWGLCKSLIRGKLNVPFGGSVKIYAYSIFFGPKLQMQKSTAPNILFKTYVYQGMKICQRHTTTFHVGYIVCWCLKKEMLTMCFDIRCRKTYILSHSHSFLRKKVDYLLWSLSTRHKRPIVIIVEVQYELGNGKLTHMIINRCWMIPYLISAKNIHIS